MVWLSKFGEKFTRHSGVTVLMDDLEEGMQQPGAIMLGGGNPGHIPELTQYFQQHLEQLALSGTLTADLSHYDGPAGQTEYLKVLADFLKAEFGWPITAENISLTNGSQSAFFNLFNLFAGENSLGERKKVLFPLAPEYIGYADGGLSEEQFVGVHPTIELDQANREFKYHIDFEQLSAQLSDDIGLMCVSRPTNPTGNVLTDDEIVQLDQLAQHHYIPLLIDNAYGMPFPSMVFNDSKPYWSENTILCLSLSKLGLPGTRCGMVIANKQITRQLSQLSGILNLAPGSIGPTIAKAMIESRDIVRLSQEVIRPFYQHKSEQTRALLKSLIPDPRFKIHRSEGAMFLWLWFEGLPINDQQLYEKLKEQGVIVVPGHYFFPGVDDAKSWPHTQQCLRLNFAMDEAVVAKGCEILAAIVNPFYQQ